MPTGLPDPLTKWQKTVQTEPFLRIKLQFQDRLLQWFAKKGRDLPWRKTRDPFAILVSELMLQQTQVDRVLEYWPRFLNKLPTFKAVAEAKEEDVLALWEGLGYYNRARNLKKLAKEIQDKYNGQFPTERDQILDLPGIGEYTAGAVMTFALEKRAPIVDTNVDRVYTRVFMHPIKGLTDREQEKIQWLLAEVLTPDQHFGEYNQGIMDFGAMQCTPDKPSCASCPMREFCRYYQQQSLTRFLK
jgi:A/G-specific adenine glycosylase